MLPPITHRTRLALVVVLVLLVGLFSLDGAYGQGFPKPGGPGNNPTGNNPFENKYRCMKCGATFTSSTIGGPGHCPSCGVKFVNGGFDPLGGPGPGGSRAPTAAGIGTSFLIVVTVIGVLGLVVLIAVGALIVFLIVRANRRPALARAEPARLRSRYRNEFDA